MTSELSKTPSTVTLGWLENLYFTSGNEAVLDAIRGSAPKELLADFSIVHRDEGAVSMRLDIQEADRIQYANFSPPQYWGCPVSILKMQLDSTPKANTFVCHGGEELTIPIDGSIRYNFLWSPGGSPLGPHSEVFDVGQLATINPSLPHHGWSNTEPSASAWLILYHNPESSAALDVASNLRNASIKNTRRRFTSEDFAKAGEYALVAWDLADRIRTQRQHLDLTIHQLADLTNMDASHISRLEAASANVSIDILVRLCDVLRIDLRALLMAKRWASASVQLSRNAISRCAWTKFEHHHMIHPTYFRLKKNEARSFPSSPPYHPGYSTWLIFEGQAILEFASGDKEKFELLNMGDVVHFRSDHQLNWRAIKETRIISFHLGEICPMRLEPSAR